MIGLDHAFSTSYAQARRRFLEAAATAGVPVTSYDHPLTGRDDEALILGWDSQTESFEVEPMNRVEGTAKRPASTRE